jgi:serine/threonine protein phosphatase PrpC
MEASQIHRWSHHAEESVKRYELASGRVVVGYRGRPDGGGRCEDAGLVIELPGDACLLAVADGMGSGPRADDASAAIIDCLSTRAEALVDDTAARVQVLDAIEEANERIRGWGVGAATTVMVVEVDAGTYRTFHVGDSEALVTGQRGKLKWQTISHSPVGYAMASGLMEVQDAMVHEERHLVDSMLGMEGMRVDVGERRRFSERDTLILATDGLFDNLAVSEIVDIIRKGRLRGAAKQLLEKTLERMTTVSEGTPGKPDDLAFILYRPLRTTSPQGTK